MGTRKGQNNFKDFQQEKVKKAADRIVESLRKIKRGVAFETLNSLVVHVAGETALHRTTILRNEEYAGIVRGFFYQQPGITRFIKEKDTTVEIEQGKNFALKVKLKNREIELNNTKKRNLQLTKIIENIAQPRSLMPTAPKNLALKDNEVEQTVSMQPSDTAFADTAQGFLDLIKKIEEKQLGIVLDYEKKQIIDITEVGEKSIIVDANRCQWFFQWLVAKSKIATFCAEESSFLKFW
jgi:hypothetical protein